MKSITCQGVLLGVLILSGGVRAEGREEDLPVRRTSVAGSLVVPLDCSRIFEIHWSYAASGLMYSAVGWDIVAVADEDRTATITAVAGELSASGSFTPDGSAPVTILPWTEGRGTCDWQVVDPLKKHYQLKHTVAKGGVADESETLYGYLDFTHYAEHASQAVIEKAVKKGVALEIQAESPYPRPQFLKLAKAMGAKFSFGTNNFDPSPKDLSRWLEAITWLDLNPTDIWSPGERWRMSASAMDLYGEMLAHSSGESLLDVEMACVEGRWDRMTVEFLCNELKTEDPVKLRFEDEQMDRHSLAAYFLSTMLDIKLPKGSEQPPCLIRCRLVPDETEVHRGFMSPHRIHVFRISEAGRKFALEKGLTYLRSGKR